MSKNDTTSRVSLVIIILALLFAGFFLLNPVTHAPTNEAQLEMTVVNEPVKQTQEITIEITDENGLLPEKEAENPTSEK